MNPESSLHNRAELPVPAWAWVLPFCVAFLVFLMSYFFNLVFCFFLLWFSIFRLGFVTGFIHEHGLLTGLIIVGDPTSTPLIWLDLALSMDLSENLETAWSSAGFCNGCVNPKDSTMRVISILVSFHGRLVSNTWLVSTVGIITHSSRSNVEYTRLQATRDLWSILRSEVRPGHSLVLCQIPIWNHPTSTVHWMRSEYYRRNNHSNKPFSFRFTNCFCVLDHSIQHHCIDWRLLLS
jgi:hypothetical protein